MRAPGSESPTGAVPQLSWADVLGELASRRDLTADMAGWAMEEVMAGNASPGQVGAFLMGLKTKGESAAEIAVFVETMLRHAVGVDVPVPVVDTCGTGGDGLGTVNISTMSAVVVAACGVPVVKHGNRAASSLSGSADVLEALGVAITLPPEAVSECVARAGIAFCFAPAFHPAMRHAGPVRRELGLPTVFNVLGPLANPARPAYQLVGVASRWMAPVVARALAQRGGAALVVRGEDGLDEVSTMAPTHVWEAREGSVQESVIDVADLGVARSTIGDLLGADASSNAEVARRVLTGPDNSAGPVRDAVVVNAAAALAVAGAAPGADLASRLSAGMALADRALTDGTAAEVLARWRAISQELAGR